WRVGCLFFQAEDGIRDWSVTGVQTCALPISARACASSRSRDGGSAGSSDRSSNKQPAGAAPRSGQEGTRGAVCRPGSSSRRRREIGRASCRERVEIPGGAVSVKQKVEEARVA